MPTLAHVKMQTEHLPFMLIQLSAPVAASRLSEEEPPHPWQCLSQDDKPHPPHWQIGKRLTPPVNGSWIGRDANDEDLHYEGTGKKTLNRVASSEVVIGPPAKQSWG